MSSLKLEMDLDEFNAFRKKLTDKTLFQEYCRQALVQACNSFLKSVRSRTPVTGQPNPVTGRVWNWKQKHPAGQLKAAWTKDNKNLEARVVTKGDGFEITLVNTTPYASWVEKGHRKFIFGRDTGEWTMGTFFVKQTEVEFENGKLARSVQLKLNKWLKEIADVK